jgi:hypothetical protein
VPSPVINPRPLIGGKKMKYFLAGTGFLYSSSYRAGEFKQEGTVQDR